MKPSKKGKGRKRKRLPEIEKQGEPHSENSFVAAAACSSSSSSSSSSLFLTPQDSEFNKHIHDHYKGFVHCSVDNLQPRDFHLKSRSALERLRDANYYQYDIVMAGGKHSSRTFVKRTLVGNPGITYKYLGLRLFAHAWSGPGASPLMKSIGEMNQSMIQMTEQFPNHQKCKYNLTLINYMEPTIRTKVGFKEEANYGMGKVSVSWHADSSLEPGSSIGVYHCLPTQRSAKWDWRIALRPSPDTSKIDGDQLKISLPKPVVVNTKDGDAYFLLGDFNETHQHCVLAGSQSNRISSTHRVAVTEEDTYDYILKRVKIARKRFRLQTEAMNSTSGKGNAIDAKVIRYCQRVLTEVEMEWIAQYWLQGAQHDKMHTWWQRPMKTLEAYWRALEVATWNLFQNLCSSEKKYVSDDVNNASSIPVDVVKVLITEFKTRQSLRQHWDERRADKIYQRRIVEEYRPVARPTFVDRVEIDDEHPKKDEENRLPKDLTLAIQDLQQLIERGPYASSSKPTKLEINVVRQSKPNKSDSIPTTLNDEDGKLKRFSNSSFETARKRRQDENRESKSKLKKKRRK